MTSSDLGISVIVCCYNSAERLLETIRHLAIQRVPLSIPWEVIVVDNASKDNTSLIAVTEAQKYSGLIERLTIIEETKQGLIYARQQGASYAKFKYLVFCDDDNWLDENYLFNAYQIMESDGKIGALGGRSSAVTDDIKFPDWFEALKHGYAVGAQSAVQGDISKSGILWGAGMITKRDLFLKCFNAHFPSILIGRKGEQLSSGEDTEYCMRLLIKGYKLHYDERLTFIHFISKARWSDEYFVRLNDAIKKGADDASSINKYSLLHKLIIKSSIEKPFFVIKIFLGFISTKLFCRRSWSFEDFKVTLFYYTQFKFDVDSNTKMIYNFHKNHSI